MKHKVEEHFSCLHSRVLQHGLGQRLDLVSFQENDKGVLCSAVQKSSVCDQVTIFTC